MPIFTPVLKNVFQHFNLIKNCSIMNKKGDSDEKHESAMASGIFGCYR